MIKNITIGAFILALSFVGYTQAFISDNGLLFLSLYLLLHIGNLSFQMPYSRDLIVPP